MMIRLRAFTCMHARDYSLVLTGDWEEECHAM